MSNEITFSDHLSGDHMEFCVYDNDRMIASIIDGLKPSGRKVLYAVQKTLNMGQEIKVANIASRASDLTSYKHGEESLQGVVTNLAAEFTGANNLPWLTKHGMFGTRPDFAASEPRYIYISRSKVINSLLHPHDEALLENQHDDGDEIEPKHFYPIFPMILLNGSEGIGNGYSHRILPRLFKPLKAAVLGYLARKKIGSLEPGFNGFTGQIEGSGGKYKIVGRVKKEGRTTLVIEDMPPFEDYQWIKYKTNVLVPLLEKKVISSFDNETDGNDWRVVIKASMDFVSKSQDELIETLKLSKNVGENLTCWNWDGKLQRFEDPESLLAHWIDGRLVIYERRRANLIQSYTEQKQALQDKITFINYWIEHSDRLVKLKKSELLSELESKVGVNADGINSCLKMPISSLTLEKVQELEQQIQVMGSLLLQVQNTTAKQIMAADVTGFNV